MKKIFVLMFIFSFEIPTFGNNDQLPTMNDHEEHIFKQQLAQSLGDLVKIGATMSFSTQLFFYTYPTAKDFCDPCISPYLNFIQLIGDIGLATADLILLGSLSYSYFSKDWRFFTNLFKKE